MKTIFKGAAVLGVFVQIKISHSHGLRSSLAYQLAIQGQVKVKEICCDYLTCLGLDPAKSNWTAAVHNSPNGAPDHIHLIVSSGVRNGIR